MLKQPKGEAQAEKRPSFISLYYNCLFFYINDCFGFQFFVHYKAALDATLLCQIRLKKLKFSLICE